MAVVIVAASDPAGTLALACQALRRAGQADARLVTLQGPPPPAATDIAHVHDGGAEVRQLLRGATVLHCVDVVPSDLTVADVPLSEVAERARVIVQCDDPRHGATLGAEAKHHGWECFTTFVSEGPWRPPLLHTGLGTLQPLLPGTRHRQVRREGIVFAASVRSLAHDPALEALVDRAEARAHGASLRVRTLSGQPPLAIRRRRRHADLTLTAARTIGREVLESLAQGVPVVANLDDATAAAYADLTGVPAPVVAPARLDEALAAIDPAADPHRDLASWARRVSDPGRWLSWLAGLWDGAASIRDAA